MSPERSPASRDDPLPFESRGDRGLPEERTEGTRSRVDALLAEGYLNWLRFRGMPLVGPAMGRTRGRIHPYRQDSF